MNVLTYMLVSLNLFLRVHTFMKTPGAFGYTPACVDITPEMLKEVMIRSQQSRGNATLYGVNSGG